MSVRGHRRRAQGQRYRRAIADAAALFLEAERTLVASVGPVNESSLYTHGNLGELLLYDVHDLAGSLPHLFEACRIGVALLGATHPNVCSKLQDFASILRQIGRYELADRLDKGRVDFRGEIDAVVRIFETVPGVGGNLGGAGAVSDYYTAAATTSGRLERWVLAEGPPPGGEPETAVAGGE